MAGRPGAYQDHPYRRYSCHGVALRPERNRPNMLAV